MYSYAVALPFGEVSLSADLKLRSNLFKFLPFYSVRPYTLFRGSR